MMLNFIVTPGGEAGHFFFILLKIKQTEPLSVHSDATVFVWVWELKKSLDLEMAKRQI